MRQSLLESGHYHLFGQPVDGKPLALVEGVATGASAHDITGWPVAIAFDGGNLQPVARELLAMFPASLFWELGDDDHHLPLESPPLPNVGRLKATAAAETMGGVSWSQCSLRATVGLTGTTPISGT